MAKSLFLKAQGIFVLYDITNESSFNDLKNWIDLIKEEGNSDIPILIVGNKLDLKDRRVVEKEKAMEYAEQQKMDYIETSSLTRENINKAITLLPTIFKYELQFFNVNARRRGRRSEAVPTRASKAPGSATHSLRASE